MDQGPGMDNGSQGTMSEVSSRKGHTDCSALLTRLSDLGYRIPPHGRYCT
jgi:hypothetical protein